VFNRRCLRDIMGVSWKDHVTNEVLLTSAGTADLEDIVADRRRRFIGHVLHLPASRPASLVMDWTPEGGSRRWGRPKQTWQDTCREDLQEMGVSGSDTHEARSIASDRDRGDNSSSSVPVGTGGPKSKSKRMTLNFSQRQCAEGHISRLPVFFTHYHHREIATISKC